MKKQFTDKGIFCRDNPYGFIYDVNHPLMNHLYRQYKQRHGLPEHFPISDRERHRFETVISRMIEAGAIIVKGAKNSVLQSGSKPRKE